MRCPQSRLATISCRQTMTASKTFGGVAGIGGAGERRRFQSRLSLTYTTNGRPQNMRMASVLNRSTDELMTAPGAPSDYRNR